MNLNKTMLTIGTAVHYAGKLLMLAATPWLPLPQAVVVLGWVVTTTALTVLFNTKRKIDTGD